MASASSWLACARAVRLAPPKPPATPERALSEFGAQRHEQRRIVLQSGLFLAEMLEGGAQVGRAATRKFFQARASKRSLKGMTRSKSTWPQGRTRPAIGRLQQAIFHKAVRADDERIGRERGQGLIGRMAVTGGPQRQHLPPGLTRSGELVHPGKRGRPQVADPIARGQRCHVQQDARSAIVRREGSAEDWWGRVHRRFSLRGHKEPRPSGPQPDRSARNRRGLLPRDDVGRRVQGGIDPAPPCRTSHSPVGGSSKSSGSQ